MTLKIGTEPTSFLKVDCYPRPFKMDMSAAHRLVVQQPGREALPVGGWIGIRFVVSKSTPEALTISGTPNPLIEPDGSYSFVPTVAGGLQPYVFELDGVLVAGFRFNTQTGELSRPPQ